MKKCLPVFLLFVFYAYPAWSQPDALVIEDVTLIDGTGNPPVQNVTIIVQGDRIRYVGPAEVDIPRGAHRIDGKGKFVIPGLMDTHIHLKGGRLGPHMEAHEDAPANEQDALSALFTATSMQESLLSTTPAAIPSSFFRSGRRSARERSPRPASSDPVLLYPLPVVTPHRFPSPSRTGRRIARRSTRYWPGSPIWSRSPKTSTVGTCGLTGTTCRSTCSKP